MNREPNENTEQDNVSSVPTDNAVKTEIPAESSFVHSQEETTANKILDEISHLAAEFSWLNRTIESRISYDETKDKAFDRLYIELDELKRNSAFDHFRPLYIDLILLFDRIENVRQDSTILPKGSTLSAFMATLSEELLEILCRHEIEPIKLSFSSFDPATQLALAIHPTSVFEENNQIDRVIRIGFRHRDRILRPEEVIVKKFKPPKNSFDPISASKPESPEDELS